MDRTTLCKNLLHKPFSEALDLLTKYNYHYYVATWEKAKEIKKTEPSPYRIILYVDNFYVYKAE